MNPFILILELFGGLILLYGFSYLLGRLFKIHKYLNN